MLWQRISAESDIAYHAGRIKNVNAGGVNRRLAFNLAS